MTTQSLAAALDAAEGRPSGFDYMRILLAVSVIVMHGTITSYGSEADFALWMTPARPFLRGIIPMFFALSGFLVGGSLYRCASLISFLGLRVLRVYPALAVEVTISALILGPLVTSLPLKEYVSHPEFYRYLLNATGHIHYLLPGVFDFNPYPRIVNAQLWTVPFELYCYVILALLVIIKVKKYPFLAPVGALSICLFHAVGKIFKYGTNVDLFILGALPGPLLVACFLFGISLYIYRYSVPVSGTLTVTAMFLSATLLCVTGGEYPATLALAYLTVSLGVRNPKRVGFIKYADYSYGIYLYGFAIQQTLVLVFPSLRSAILNIVIAAPVTAVLAWLSWNFVERPAFRLKIPLYALERWALFKLKLFYSNFYNKKLSKRVQDEPSNSRSTDRYAENTNRSTSID